MCRVLFSRGKQLIPWNNCNHARSFSRWRTKFRRVDVGLLVPLLIQPLQDERQNGGKETGIVIDHSYRGRKQEDAILPRYCFSACTPFLVKDNVNIELFYCFVSPFLALCQRCSILEENWLSI